MKYVIGILLALSLTACAGKTIPVVVGQTGLAVVQSIGQLQTTTKTLTDNGAITPAVALVIQTKLLALNDKAKPLPDILREIDALTKAGGAATTKIDQAIAVLQVLGSDLTTVVVGVPVSDTAKALLDAVTATQTTIQTTLIQIARLKGAQTNG